MSLAPVSAIVSSDCDASIELANFIAHDANARAKLVIIPVEPRGELCQLTLAQLRERGSWAARLLPVELACVWLAEDAAAFHDEHGIGYPTLVEDGRVLDIAGNAEYLDELLGPQEGDE